MNLSKFLFTNAFGSVCLLVRLSVNAFLAEQNMIITNLRYLLSVIRGPMMITCRCGRPALNSQYIRNFFVNIESVMRSYLLQPTVLTCTHVGY